MTQFIKSLTEDKAAEWKELFEIGMETNSILREFLKTHGIQMGDDYDDDGCAILEAEWDLWHSSDGFGYITVDIFTDPEVLELRKESFNLYYDEDFDEDDDDSEEKERYDELQDDLARIPFTGIKVEIRADDPPAWVVGLLMGNRITWLSAQVAEHEKEMQKAVNMLEELKENVAGHLEVEAVGEIIDILEISLEGIQL